MTKKIVKSRVLKPFNNGTQSKAAFFGMLKGALRKLSMYWKPTTQARINARRAYKGKSKLQKWEYQCNKCKKWFKGTEIVVDHIDAIGVLADFDDLPRVVKKMFVEVDGLQVLCNDCHAPKTAKENKERRLLKTK